MIQMFGYDASYSNEAFQIYTSARTGRKYAPDNERLRHVLERAMQSVLEQGGGCWVIVDKHRFRPSDSGSAKMELRVLVLAGGDQYDQLLAAVAHFEGVLAKLLGAPIDTAHRYIEPDTPTHTGHIRVAGQIRSNKTQA